MTDQTEQPEDAMENLSNSAQYNPTNPNTSAGEIRQAQASHMSQDTSWNSGRRMDVVSSFVIRVYKLQLNIGVKK